MAVQTNNDSGLRLWSGLGLTLFIEWPSTLLMDLIDNNHVTRYQTTLHYTALGLREDSVVMTCMNRGHKVDAYTYDRWLMALKRFVRSRVEFMRNVVEDNS